MHIDWTTIIGLGVLAFQAYNQYIMSLMRSEISDLKVLIYRDFVTKTEHQSSSNKRY